VNQLPRPNSPRVGSSLAHVVLVLLKAVVLSGVLVLAVGVALYSRSASTHVGDSYDDNLPFRPRIVYSSSDITVVNTETEPYYEVQLTLFVGWTACRVMLGTINSGSQVSIPLTEFKYDDGTFFDPISSRAKLLEVRARLKGQDVHRDLPPPR
jgi:hypothetical protein